MKRILCLILMVLMVNLVAAYSVGISPAGIVVDNLNRGSVYEGTILVSRSPSDVDAIITANFIGETKEWLTLDKGNEILFSKGVDRLPVKVTVNIPKDAPNGFYRGRIDFSAEPAKGEMNTQIGSKVSPGVAAVIELNITGKEVIDYTVRSITALDTEIGRGIPVIVKIKNAASTKVRPTKVEVDVYDPFKEKLLFSEEVKTNGYVNAFSQEELTYTANNKNLTANRYWLTARVFQDDMMIKTQDVRFGVLEKGGLKKSGVLKDLSSTNASLGTPVSITGIFQNDGSLPLTGKLKGELKKDGKLIEVIESDEVEVGLKKSSEIQVYFTPKEKGKYTFSAKVYYEGKSTDKKTLTIDVSNDDGKENLLYFGIGILVLLIVIGVVGYFVWDEYF